MEPLELPGCRARGPLPSAAEKIFYRTPELGDVFPHTDG